MHETPTIARVPVVGSPEPNDHVDLWCFFYESALRDHTLRRRYRELISSEERERCERFVFEHDQVMSLATRTLVRTVLSHYAAVDPKAWRFESDSRGKPFVSSPVEPRLWFNVSNTRGLVVCAVSQNHEKLGVDTEYIRRNVAAIELADRFFSRREATSLRAMPREHQCEHFFAYWTLKECYVKARGLGLTVPLNAFSFVLDDTNIGIEFEQGLEDGVEHWRFALLRASSEHFIAVGIAGKSLPVIVRARKVVPLVSMEPFEPCSTIRPGVTLWRQS